MSMHFSNNRSTFDEFADDFVEMVRSFGFRIIDFDKVKAKVHFCRIAKHLFENARQRSGCRLFQPLQQVKVFRKIGQI